MPRILRRGTAGEEATSILLIAASVRANAPLDPLRTELWHQYPISLPWQVRNEIWASDSFAFAVGPGLFVAVAYLLIFHGLGRALRPLELAEDRVWVAPDFFETVLDIVRSRADVTVTFDDGNRSDVEIAAPALLRRGMKGLFFPVAGRLGQPGFLGRSDLRELARAGMEIGSHGLHHRSWRRLATTELRDEIWGAKAILEEALGARIRAAACPFGAYDRRALAELRRAGFERVYTSDGGLAEADAWLQPRTSVLASHDVDAVARLLRARPSHPGEIWKRAKRSWKALA